MPSAVEGGPNARRGATEAVNETGGVVFAEPADPAVSVIVVAWGTSPYLLECLTSVQGQSADLAYQVVLVLNDVASDVKDAVTRRVRGAKVIESNWNLGFAGSVNVAVSAARGAGFVVVHDDVEVAPDWLDRLVTSAEEHPEADVVGGPVLAPGDAASAAIDALVAGGPGRPPAGSGVAKEMPSDGGLAEVSDCAFFLRRTAWNRIGGLDEVFHPFGFVTMDLCARVVETGGLVRVEPAATVRRHHSDRTGHLYRRCVMTLNSELFELRRSRARRAAAAGGGSEVEPSPPGSGVARAGTAKTRASGNRPSRSEWPGVLVIDDAVPDPSLGAGSGRMADVLVELATAGGFRVDVLPLVAPSAADPARARALGVEVVDPDLKTLLSPGGRCYGLVIVSRPHNWASSIETLRRLAPGIPVVYDAEALFHRRLERQIPFVIDAPTAIRVERDAARLSGIEREIARQADFVVAISEDEAGFFRANSPDPARVAVHPPFLAGSRVISTELAARRDLAFVAAWSAGPDSPNADALVWFTRQILPRVRARVPGARLRVTGVDPPANVQRLVTPAIEFVGQVERLEDLYGEVRVVVVPIRFGSGVKLKTVEAVQYGVPTVTTTVGAEGIPFDGSGAVVVADDPTEFAGAVARLLSDAAAWESQRRQVLAQQAAWAERPAGSVWPSVVEGLLWGGSAGGGSR